MTKILRLRAVIEKTGLSKSTIYDAIESGNFPKPVRLSIRTVGWIESDIEEWISSRKPTNNKTHK